MILAALDIVVLKVRGIFTRKECEHDWWVTGYFRLDDVEEIDIRIEECSLCGAVLAREP